MNANEIRFGNLLQTHRSEPNELVQVNTIATHPEHADIILISTCHFPHLTLCQCEPITLTEEWVVRLGGKCDIGWTVGIIELEEEGGDFYYQLDCGRLKINYVHHLQNLHFALSNMELPISS